MPSAEKARKPMQVTNGLGLVSQLIGLVDNTFSPIGQNELHELYEPLTER